MANTPELPGATPPAAPKSLVRSATVVSAAVFLSRITGLVRERIMANLFGASEIYDAFVLGFRIPNLTRDLFAEGALSSAFVPVFTKYLATKSKAEARELSNLVGTALMLIVGSFCAAGMIFSPQLVELLAAPFHAVPGKFELAVLLTRIMFPFLLLVALAAQAMGVLNACHQFGIPALSSTFFNVGSVSFGLFLGYVVGPRFGITHITGMAYGVVFGGALQLLFQVPALIRAGFAFKPQFHFAHPGLGNVLRLMGPAVLGNASVQVNVMVNTKFASGITDVAGHIINGPVSWLNYAFRFMQLPLGLFGVAIASATLPEISRSAAANDLAGFRKTLSRSLSLVLLLTIPSSVILAVLGESMIAVVYQSGRFKAADTHQTALALSWYALGLSGYSALKVLAPAFYALNDARTPMVVSMISILINYATASTMVRFAGLGHAGLALSTSAVALFGFLVLLVAMRRRLGGIEGAALLSSFLKIVAGSIAMGAVCTALGRAIHHWFGSSIPTQAFNLAVSIPAGIVVYYAVCMWLRVEEIETARRTIAGPLMRRLGFSRN